MMSICYKAANLMGFSGFRASSRYKRILYIFILHGLFLSCTALGDHYGFEGIEDLDWFDCGGSEWFQDCSMGYNSNCSLRSGPIENEGLSSICKNITGPARVTFYWKSDSTIREGGQLLFMVDDDVKRVYDSYGWRHESYSIRGKGNHTIKWVFRKFRYFPQWKGVGRVDCVNVTRIGKKAFELSPMEVGLSPTGVGLISPTGNASIDVIQIAFPIRGPTNTEIELKILIKNSGEVPLQEIVVKNILSSGLSYINDSGSIRPNESTNSGDGSTIITWNNISINPSKSIEIYFNAIIDGSRPGALASNVRVAGISEGRYNNVTGNDTKEVIRDDPPIVELLSPTNGSKLYPNSPIQFIFNVTDDHLLSGCSLYIDDKCVSSEPEHLNGSQYIFRHQFGKDDVEKWHGCNIKCYDNFSQWSNKSNLSVYINKPNKVHVDKEKCDGFLYYDNIQDAIINISINGTIIVEPGTYNGTVIINKSLNLIGNDRPIINSNMNDAIHIAESNVMIKGFKIEKVDQRYRSTGILVFCAECIYHNITIVDNIICGRHPARGYNISLHLENVLYSNISDNIINDSQIRGIYLNKVENCNISNNKISNNPIKSNPDTYRMYCIKLKRSQNILILNNLLTNSKYGICSCESSFCNENNTFGSIYRAREVNCEVDECRLD